MTIFTQVTETWEEERRAADLEGSEKTSEEKSSDTGRSSDTRNAKTSTKTSAKTNACKRKGRKPSGTDQRDVQAGTDQSSGEATTSVTRITKTQEVRQYISEARAQGSGDMSSQASQENACVIVYPIPSAAAPPSSGEELDSSPGAETPTSPQEEKTSEDKSAPPTNAPQKATDKGTKANSEVPRAEERDTTTKEQEKGNPSQQKQEKGTEGLKSENEGDSSSAPKSDPSSNGSTEANSHESTPPPPAKKAQKKWGLDLVWHFLYIITPDSSIPSNRSLTTKFVIQVTVVYLGYLVLAGLVVSFLLYLLRNRLQDIERGEKRDYYYLTNHIVIIGSRDYLWKLIEHIANSQEQQPIPPWVPKTLRDPWKGWRDRLKEIRERILDNEGLSLFTKRRSILILTSRPAKDVRDELDMHLPRHLVRRTILTHGSYTDEEALRRLNIPQCKAIYVIGETLDESMDSMNLECVRTISRQVLPQLHHLTPYDKGTAQGKKPIEEKRIPCHVYFERTATYALLQRGAFEPFRNLIFIPYCFHKNWTDKILCVSDPYTPPKKTPDHNASQQDEEDDEVRYMPLDREPITKDSSRYVHLIIIGCSRMGLALATEAAHILHFPNFVTNQIKSRITLISSEVDVRMQTLQNEVKPFFNYVEWEYIDLSALYDKRAQEESERNRTVFKPEKDCIDQKWTFIKGDAHSPILQRRMKEYAEDPNALVTVAVCIANDHDASRIALNLPREFYKTGEEIPILVRQESGAGLMHALHYTKTHNYAKVLPFGMRLDEFDLVQKDNDQSAAISWVVYRNTQKMHQAKRFRIDFTTYRERDKVEDAVSEFFAMGNDQKMKWNDLPMRMKFANRYRSYLLWSYLRSLGKTNFKCKSQVDLDGDMRHLRDTLMFNGELMAEVEHNRWNVEQLLLGKLPRPTLNTEESDEINDIVPYKDLKRINQWRRVNLTLFLYLPVKYYFEAKLLRQQREEVEREKKEGKRR